MDEPGFCTRPPGIPAFTDVLEGRRISSDAGSVYRPDRYGFRRLRTRALGGLFQLWVVFFI
jgi:hypothetical protein